jgi:hypothetical protein
MTYRSSKNSEKKNLDVNDDVFYQHANLKPKHLVFCATEK